MPTVLVCSQPFTALARSQAKVLGYPDLPLAVTPRPFGACDRDEIRALAAQFVDDVARGLCTTSSAPVVVAATASSPRALLIEAAADWEDANRLFLERGWGDGLMLTPPTAERVARMLRATTRAPDEVLAFLPPENGAATVERIAINAVMAGCHPEYLPVLLAATEAMADPRFALQNIQTTTNPVAVFLVVNGPIARTLGINSGPGCLGPGNWANATLGRAIRLIQQNIGGARPGQKDLSTHGQPAKYTCCCAENEAENPWEPLHVERGYARDASTVTVVGALSMLNMSMHPKNAVELLRVIADTMIYPAGSDYCYGGAPWLVLCPEHAHVLKRDGLTKSDVKRALWEQSRLAASRFTETDFKRTQDARREELGTITRDSLLPISPRPDDISIMVAGGAGPQSLFVPVTGGHSLSTTREVRL